MAVWCIWATVNKPTLLILSASLEQCMVTLHWTFKCWKWKKKLPSAVANNYKGDLGHDKRDLPLVADENTHKWVRRWPMTLTCSTLQHLWAWEWRAQRALVAEPFQVIGPVFISIYSQNKLLPFPSHKFPFPPQKGQINSKVPHFNFLAVDYLAQPAIIVLSKNTINPPSPCVQTWRPLQRVWEKPGASGSISVRLLCSSRKRKHTSFVIDRLLAKMMQHFSTEINGVLTGEPVLSLKNTLFRLCE